MSRVTATRDRLRVLVMVAGVVGGALPVVGLPRSAQAQTENARDEAKHLFAHGSAAFLARRYGEALESLRLSYKLVPSPNSGLLIARCLRELDRPVEAVEMYDAVAVDAHRRAAGADTKYAQTAEAATAEGNAVRATLGTVRVRVANPQPGARIEIDGVGAPATGAEIVALHTPGEVTVKLKPRNGVDQSQRATLAAGGEVRMEFSPSEAAPSRIEAPPALPPRDGEPPSWTVPAALVAGGVAVVGGGLFVGFGLRSQSIYDELRQACGTAGCGPEQRSRADEGKRDQTVANVGLVVGITGAAAAIAFLLVRAYAPRSASGATNALASGALRVDF